MLSIIICAGNLQRDGKKYIKRLRQGDAVSGNTYLSTPLIVPTDYPLLLKARFAKKAIM
jgi:hypothetical protein